MKQHSKPQVQGSEIVDDVLYISGPVKLANAAFPLIPSDKFDPESTLMRNAKKFDLQQQRQQGNDDAASRMIPAGAIPRGSNRPNDELHAEATIQPPSKMGNVDSIKLVLIFEIISKTFLCTLYSYFCRKSFFLV